MASELCLSLTKYFMFVFNLIFFFLGSALLSLGLWMMFSQTRLFMHAPSYMSLALFPYLLIISGAVTISLGFFGSLGALKEIKCMLAIYFILLTVIAAAQTIGGVLLITQKGTFQSSLESSVKDLIQRSGRNDSSLRNFEQILDILQQETHCCGWSHPDDWPQKPCSCFYPVNDTVNATNNELCPCDNSNLTTCAVYAEGCQGFVRDWLDQHILIIVGVVFALLVVEICGTILSMYVYRQASTNYSLTLYR